MSRLEENVALVNEIGKRIDEYDKTQSLYKDHTIFFNQLISSVLIDISRSLAIIADKMEDGDEIRIKPEYMHDICGVAMIRVEDITRILNDMPTIQSEEEKVIGIESRQPHQVSEVICVKCGKRWISVRPQETLLKELECENCGAGYVVETGQILEEWGNKS